MMQLSITCVAVSALAAAFGMTKPKGSREQQKRFIAAYVFIFAAAGLTYFGT